MAVIIAVKRFYICIKYSRIGIRLNDIHGQAFPRIPSRYTLTAAINFW